MNKKSGCSRWPFLGLGLVYVHIRITWRYIPELGNIYNYNCENLKSYIITNTVVLLPGYVKTYGSVPEWEHGV
jgi:hypothetical protein